MLHPRTRREWGCSYPSDLLSARRTRKCQGGPMAPWGGCCDELPGPRARVRVFMTASVDLLTTK